MFCRSNSAFMHCTVNVPATMAFAANIIGKYVVPPDWINDPVTTVCAGTAAPPPKVHSDRTSQSNATAAAICTDLPNLSPCSVNFCKQTACEEVAPGLQNFRMIVQLDQPISGIDQVQIAANTADQWAQSHPMITCTADK